MVAERIAQEANTKERITEPQGPGNMEDQIFHLFEMLQISASNRQATDSHTVPEYRIRELIRGEVDVRISHVKRDLETRLTYYEDRNIARQ